MLNNWKLILNLINVVTINKLKLLLYKSHIKNLYVLLIKILIPEYLFNTEKIIFTRKGGTTDY